MRSQRQAGLNPFNLASVDAASFAGSSFPAPVKPHLEKPSSFGLEHVSTRGLTLESDDEGTTPRSATPTRRGSQCSLTCAVGLACFCSLASCALTAFLVGFMYPSPMSVHGLQRQSACGLPDTPEAARARALTGEYLTARGVNDIDHLRTFFIKSTKTYLDVNNAGFILGSQIRGAVGTQMEGRAEIAKYYEAFPAGPGDPKTNVDALICSGNVCTETAVLSRNVVGDFKEVSIFSWDFSEAKLQRMVVRISAA